MTQNNRGHIIMKKFFCVIIALVLSLSGCNTAKQTNKMPKELDDLNSVTTLAVRSYIYSRLLTDKLIACDIYVISQDELKQLVNETTYAWDTTVKITDEIPNIADNTIELIQKSDESTLSKTKASASLFLTAYAAENTSEWAKRISGQFDAIKGANKLKQLGEQLGTDAKKAYQQLTMAQNILQGEAATEEGDLYQKWQQIAEGTKTACKTGMFVCSTIVTASTTSAVAGCVTLGEATSIIVSGVDVLLDVGSTSSNIILGVDNKASIGLDKIKSDFAPVSYVFGIINFQDATIGERISFVGESFTDWFYDGKIAGIKVTENGTDVKSAWQVDTKGKSEVEIKKEIEKITEQNPDIKATSIDELIKENHVDLGKYISELESILEKYAAAEKTPATEDNTQDVDISGSYSGTSVISGLNSSGKEEKQEPRSIQFEIKLNGDKLTYIKGEDVIDCNYDSKTGKASFEQSDANLELIFNKKATSVTVTATMNMKFDGGFITSNINATRD